jgi:hypothetical protein
VPIATDIPVAIAFAGACVRPGASQTITVTTSPGTAVIYEAIYSDGNNPKSTPYYGGNKGGQADRNGIWSDTWVINARAPAGPVRVDVVAARRSGQTYRSASFALADTTGKCR